MLLGAQETSKKCRYHSVFRRSVAFLLSFLIFSQNFLWLALERNARAESVSRVPDHSTPKPSPFQIAEDLAKSQDKPLTTQLTEFYNMMDKDLPDIGKTLEKWDNEKMAGKAKEPRPYTWGSGVTFTETIKNGIKTTTGLNVGWKNYVNQAVYLADLVQLQLKDPHLSGQAKTVFLDQYIQSVLLPMRQFLTLTYDDSVAGLTDQNARLALLKRLELRVSRNDFPVIPQDASLLDNVKFRQTALVSNGLFGERNVRLQTDAHTLPRDRFVGPMATPVTATVQLGPQEKIMQDLRAYTRSNSQVGYMRALKLTATQLLLQQLLLYNQIEGRDHIYIPEGCQKRDAGDLAAKIKLSTLPPTKRQELISNILTNTGAVSGEAGMGSEYEKLFSSHRDPWDEGDGRDHSYSTSLAHDAALEAPLKQDNLGIIDDPHSEPWFDAHRDFDQVLNHSEDRMAGNLSGADYFLRWIRAPKSHLNLEGYYNEVRSFPEDAPQPGINQYLMNRMKETGVDDWRKLFCRLDDQGQPITSSSPLCARLVQNRSVKIDRLPPLNGPDRYKFYAINKLAKFFHTKTPEEIRAMLPKASDDAEETPLFSLEQIRDLKKKVLALEKREGEGNLPRMELNSQEWAQTYPVMQEMWSALSRRGQIDNQMTEWDYMNAHMEHDPWVAVRAAYLLEKDFQSNGPRALYPTPAVHHEPIATLNILPSELVQANGSLMTQHLEGLTLDDGQNLRLKIPSRAVNEDFLAKLQNLSADPVDQHAQNTGAKFSDFKYGKLRITVPASNVSGKFAQAFRAEQAEDFPAFAKPTTQVPLSEALPTFPLQNTILKTPTANFTTPTWPITPTQKFDPYQLKFSQLFAKRTNGASPETPLKIEVIPEDVTETARRPWPRTADFDSRLSEYGRDLHMDQPLSPYAGNRALQHDEKVETYRAITKENNQDTQFIFNAATKKANEKSAREELLALHESVLLTPAKAKAFARQTVQPADLAATEADIDHIFAEQDKDGRIRALHRLYNSRKLTDAQLEAKGKPALTVQISKFLDKYGGEARDSESVKDSFMKIDSAVKEKIGSRLVLQNTATRRAVVEKLLKELCAIPIKNSNDAATTEAFKKLYLRTIDAQNALNAQLGVAQVPKELRDRIDSKDGWEKAQELNTYLQVGLAAGAVACTVVTWGACAFVLVGGSAAGLTYAGILAKRHSDAAQREREGQDLLAQGFTNQAAIDKYARRPGYLETGFAAIGVAAPLKMAAKGSAALWQAGKMEAREALIGAQLASDLRTIGAISTADHVGMTTARNGFAKASTLMGSPDAGKTVSNAVSDSLVNFFEQNPQQMGKVLSDGIRKKMARYEAAQESFRVGKTRSQVIKKHWTSPFTTEASVKKELQKLGEIKAFAEKLSHATPAEFKTLLQQNISKVGDSGETLSTLLSSLPMVKRKELIHILSLHNLPFNYGNLGINQGTKVRDVMRAYDNLMRQEAITNAARKYSISTSVDGKTSQFFWGYKYTTDEAAESMILKLTEMKNLGQTESQAYKKLSTEFTVMAKQRDAVFKETAQYLALIEKNAITRRAPLVYAGPAPIGPVPTATARGPEEWLKILNSAERSKIDDAIAEASVFLEKVPLKQIIQPRLYKTLDPTQGTTSLEHILRNADDLEVLDLLRPLGDVTRGKGLPKLTQ